MLCINVCDADPRLKDELVKALAYRAQVLALVGRYLAPYTKAVLGALDELRELGANGGLSPQSRAPLAELAEHLQRYEDWVRSAQEAAPWESEGRGPVFTLEAPVTEEALGRALGWMGVTEISEVFGLERMADYDNEVLCWPNTAFRLGRAIGLDDDSTEDLGEDDPPEPPSAEDLADSLVFPPRWGGGTAPE